MFQSLLPVFIQPAADSGRLFLIRRSERANFKAGNIMNFIDERGADYEFMLVLDADSVRLGETVERLILRIEKTPRVEIFQSLMVPIATLSGTRHFFEKPPR
jgi:membrane glycosyltransferase